MPHSPPPDDRFSELFDSLEASAPDESLKKSLLQQADAAFVAHNTPIRKKEETMSSPYKAFAAMVTIAALVVLFVHFGKTREQSGTGGSANQIALSEALGKTLQQENLQLALVQKEGKQKIFRQGEALRFEADQPKEYKIAREGVLYAIDERANRATMAPAQFFSKEKEGKPQLSLAAILGGDDPTVVKKIQLAMADTKSYRRMKSTDDRQRWVIPVGKTNVLELMVNPKTSLLDSVEYFTIPAGNLDTTAGDADKTAWQTLAAIRVAPASKPLDESLFIPAPTLSADGRVAKILDLQGLVSLRDATTDRFRLVNAPHTVVMPESSVQTDTRGANAVLLRLVGNGTVTLGPGTLVDILSPRKIQVHYGEMKVVPAKKLPITLVAPDGSEVVVKKTTLFRTVRTTEAGKQVVTTGANKEAKLIKLRDAPLWLAGFEGTTTKDPTGSLIAKVDGREVALTVGYHKVTVDIRDQIARTVVEESFKNHTDAQLEGVFYFPLPADASISGFGMWIGDELVEADVVEKQRAREIYETILREKRDPGLLEWQGGNLFKARVYPIFPHSEKRIRITYTQVLPVEDGKYRYSYALNSELLKQNPVRQLDVNLTVSTTQPIESVECLTHPARIQNIASKDGKSSAAKVDFSAQEYAPSRDFEVVVALNEKADLPPIRITPHLRGEDGYFLLQCDANSLAPKAADATKTKKLPPQNVLILADTSASISPQQRKTQQQLVAALLTSLREQDKFQLATCDVNTFYAFTEESNAYVPATRKNVEKARRFLDARRSLGWTNLNGAFEQVFSTAPAKTNVLYIGDGQATNGDCDPARTAREIDALAKKYAKNLASVHAISTGSRYEKMVLDAIASGGGTAPGTVRAVTSSKTPGVIANEILDEMTSPTLRNLAVKIEGFPTACVYPTVLPNLVLGREQLMLGRYQPVLSDATDIVGAAIPATGTKAEQTGTITLTGTFEGKPFEVVEKISLAGAEKGNSFIPRLWARKHLDKLLQESQTPEVKEDVIALSERYQIMTPYTSFLVLESDADRKRFNVKRTSRMRDGEKFFAKGRDDANYLLVQAQIEKAKLWRTNLRQNILAQFMTLGRTPLAQSPAEKRMKGLLEDSRRRVKESRKDGKLSLPVGSSTRYNWSKAKAEVFADASGFVTADEVDKESEKLERSKDGLDSLLGFKTGGTVGRDWNGRNGLDFDGQDDSFLLDAEEVYEEMTGEPAPPGEYFLRGASAMKKSKAYAPKPSMRKVVHNEPEMLAEISAAMPVDRPVLSMDYSATPPPPPASKPSPSLPMAKMPYANRLYDNVGISHGGKRREMVDRLSVVSNELLDVKAMEESESRLSASSLFTPKKQVKYDAEDKPVRDLVLGEGVSSGERLDGTYTYYERNADISRWPQSGESADWGWLGSRTFQNLYWMQQLIPNIPAIQQNEIPNYDELPQSWETAKQIEEIKEILATLSRSEMLSPEKGGLLVTKKMTVYNWGLPSSTSYWTAMLSKDAGQITQSSAMPGSPLLTHWFTQQEVGTLNPGLKLGRFIKAKEPTPVLRECTLQTSLHFADPILRPLPSSYGSYVPTWTQKKGDDLGVLTLETEEYSGSGYDITIDTRRQVITQIVYRYNAPEENGGKEASRVYSKTIFGDFIQVPSEGNDAGQWFAQTVKSYNNDEKLTNETTRKFVTLAPKEWEEAQKKFVALRKSSAEFPYLLPSVADAKREKKSLADHLVLFCYFAQTRQVEEMMEQLAAMRKLAPKQAGLDWIELEMQRQYRGGDLMREKVSKLAAEYVKKATARKVFQESAQYKRLAAASPIEIANAGDTLRTEQHLASKLVNLANYLASDEKNLVLEKLEPLFPAAQPQANYYWLNQMVGVYSSLGQRTEQLEAYKKIAILQPWNAYHFINYANILNQLGRTDEAIKFIDAVADGSIFKDWEIKCDRQPWPEYQIGNFYQQIWQYYRNQGRFEELLVRAPEDLKKANYPQQLSHEYLSQLIVADRLGEASRIMKEWLTDAANVKIKENNVEEPTHRFPRAQAAVQQLCGNYRNVSYGYYNNQISERDARVLLEFAEKFVERYDETKYYQFSSLYQNCIGNHRVTQTEAFRKFAKKRQEALRTQGRIEELTLDQLQREYNLITRAAIPQDKELWLQMLANVKQRWEKELPGVIKAEKDCDTMVEKIDGEYEKLIKQLKEAKQLEGKVKEEKLQEARKLYAKILELEQEYSILVSSFNGAINTWHTTRNFLLTLLRQNDHEQVLPFLREQLAKGPVSRQLEYMQALYGELLVKTWSAKLQKESLELIPKIIAKQYPAEDELATGFAQATMLQSWIDRVLPKRITDQRNAVPHPEKLTRTEKAKKYREIAEKANQEMVAQLKDLPMFNDEARRWATLERLYLQTRLGDDVSEEVWSVIDNKPLLFDLKAELVEYVDHYYKLETDLVGKLRTCYSLKEGEKLPKFSREELVFVVKAQDQLRLNQLRRVRALQILLYFAAKKKTSEKNFSRLLAKVDEALKLDPQNRTFRGMKYKLLVAGDKVTELEKLITAWMDEAQKEKDSVRANAWKMQLAYLLAEQSKLAEAVALLEQIEDDDELGPQDYQTLAMWYHALDLREKKDAAELKRWETAEENVLSNEINRRVNALRGNENKPGVEVDPMLLKLFRVVLQKTESPQNYVYQLRNAYRYTHDFRVLEALADGALGHSRVRIYDYLQAAQGIFGSYVKEEATIDSLIERIENVARKNAKTDADNRALDILTMLAERQACNLLDQDGPHAAKVLAAMRRAFDKYDWTSDYERLRMAQFLRNFGTMRQPELKKEQLREMRLLHQAAAKESSERLQLADILANQLWSYGTRDEALATWEAALAEARPKQSVLFSNLQNVINNYINVLGSSSLKRYRQAETLLETWLADAKESKLSQPSSFTRWLVERKFRLYSDFFTTADADFAAGRGEVLYKKLIVMLTDDLRQHSNNAYNRIYQILNIFRNADGCYKSKRKHSDGELIIATSPAEDVKKFVFDELPDLLRSSDGNYRSIVREVARTLRDVVGKREALTFLLDEIEEQPRHFLLNQNNDLFYQFGHDHSSMSSSQCYLGRLLKGLGNPADLDKRLAAIVCDRLERELTQRGRSARYYLCRNDRTYYLASHRDDFIAVAEKVCNKHHDSSPIVTRVAQYIIGHLADSKHKYVLYATARKMMQEAYEADVLTKSDQMAYVQMLRRYPEGSYLHLRQSWKAIPILQKLIEQDTNNPHPSTGYCTTLMNCCREAADSKKEESEKYLALLEKTADEALKFFRKRPDWRTGGHLAALAVACYSARLDKQAVELYTELIDYHKSRNRGRTDDHTLSSYYQNLAQCESRLGHLEKAVDAACGSIVCWGRNADYRRNAISNLASILRSAKDLNAYVAKLDEETEKTGLEKPVVRRALGEVYLSKGDLKNARAQYEAYLDLQPYDVQAQDALLQTLERLGDIPATIAQIHRAIIAMPEVIKYYQKLAALELKQENKDAAIRAATSAVDALPEESQSHQQLAQFFEQLKEYDEALNQWDQVDRIRSLEDTGLRMKGELLYRLERLEELKGVLDAYNKRFPGRSSSIKHRYEQLKQKKERATNATRT